MHEQRFRLILDSLPTRVAVPIGAVPPVMLKSTAYPNGLPMDVFDGIRNGVADNRRDSR